MITFTPDREDSDKEDPDFSPYTPRVDLEEVHAARPSKASPLDLIRDWSHDDDCCILEPIIAKPLAYTLPTGDPATSSSRADVRQNAPSGPARKVKKTTQR